MTAVAAVVLFVAADPAPAPAPSFAKDIAPLVEKYCLRCHGETKPKGGIVLSRTKTDADIVTQRALWEKVGDNLRSGDMPPAGAKRPTAAELDTLNRWLDAVVYKLDCDGPRDPGRVTLRRLNRVEYQNTIRDLVGVDYSPARDFPADDVGYGFDNIGDVLSLPPLLMEKYLTAAEEIIERAWRRPELRKRLMPRAPSPTNRDAMRQNLSEFASRAWRRPATEEEVKRLLGLVRMARDQGDAPEVGQKLAFQAVLISPHFLFRVEQDPTNKDLLLSEWELATRLSYFLWSSMPDDELFGLAKEGKLRQAGELERQVQRMLRSPKSRALAEHFGGQWLNTRSLSSLSFDPKRFPGITPRMLDDMTQETVLFVHHVVQENRPILDFLNADYTFVNRRLARHYGLDGVTGDNFQKVSLAGSPRGGVLTQASVLAVTSNPTRTSPVKRGKWILENLLGTPPPPPPPDVDELEETEELHGTLRQQMEQHRKNPSCASCHARMDPLGFGLENFNAVGIWRDQEGKHKIDASGVLPDGSKFNGPEELRQVLLAKKDLFVKCFVDKLLTYALGRGTERSDRCYIEEMAKKVAKAEYKFQSVVIEIVRSDPFQKRRPKGEKP